MRKAVDLEELRQSISSAEFLELEEIYLRATGHELGQVLDEGRADEWTRIGMVLDAIELLVCRANEELKSYDADRDESDRLKSLFATLRVGCDDYRSAVLGTLSPSLLLSCTESHLIHCHEEKTEEEFRASLEKFIRPTDVFVSFNTAKHGDAAATLVEYLEDRGFSVWFDRKILGRQELNGIRRTKKELIYILREAARNAANVVVFEAALGVVIMGPGKDENQALEENSIMIDQHTGAIVGWNWQKLEIDASQRLITIHASDRSVRVSSESDKQIAVERYSDDDNLHAVVAALLSRFGRRAV